MLENLIADLSDINPALLVILVAVSYLVHKSFVIAERITKEAEKARIDMECWSDIAAGEINTGYNKTKNLFRALDTLGNILYDTGNDQTKKLLEKKFPGYDFKKGERHGENDKAGSNRRNS